MTINLKIDISGLKAEIAAEIRKQDALAEKAANQLLIEGKNAAHQLALHDTNYMRGDALEAGSHVDRIGPCRYSITVGSLAEYAEAQEFGPKSGKKIWRFRPFIRPAVKIMEVKFDEVCDRVWGD
jgi:hypothetical protein